MRAYTYLVKHKPSNKFYYGVRIKNKIDPKLDLFVRYFTSSKIIKELLVQDGIDAFEWQVRQEFDNELAAVTWEAKVLQRCQVLERQDLWINKNAAGRKLLTKHGAKVISATHKGKPKSAEHREKIRQALKGKNLGRKLSPETIEKIKSKSIGANNPMYGKSQSEETKRKIGEANKIHMLKNNHMRGKTQSEENKLASSLANTGKKHTSETIAKRVAKQKGQQRSEETRALISLRVREAIAKRKSNQ